MRAFKAFLGGTALMLSLAATNAQAAAPTVFACSPEWASLVKVIGGTRITNITLGASPFDDVDTMKTTPAIVSAVARADLVICTGVGLEDQWLPALLERANNPKVTKGKPGYFMAGEFAKILVEAAGHAHSHGDMTDSKPPHAHVHGDPNNVRLVAGQLAKRLIAIDPDGTAVYTENAKTFIAALTALTKDLKAKAAPLKGVTAVSQHDDSAYLFDWIGIRTDALIEEGPGTSAGPQHLAEIVTDIPKNKVRFVTHAAYQNPAQAKSVTDSAKIPLVKLPFTVGGTPEASDLFSFYKDSVNRLLDGLAGKPRN